MARVCEIGAAELQLSDTVLGKGAFGEVRVARWRGMGVALKILHTSQDADPELEQTIEHEIEMLSELRHPNLVLFLGVCRDGAERGPRSAIVTELLSCSLYDLLETKKVKFGLPDILDVSVDIAHGLTYLHGHNPIIVHRDISAKNILIHGNRAKITDLGQAKLFDQSTLSRQTGMPGAMAYSAPEVLTGRYSAKIDMFSFGVLLAQMITGEYPRVDRRDDQFQRAAAIHECLSKLLADCTSYNPEDRPASHRAGQFLTELRENDRHYPISRRTTPEKDVGVEALAWMRERAQADVAELSLRLEQTSKHLRAEEDRLRIEAARCDALQLKYQDEVRLGREARERVAALEAEGQTLRGKASAAAHQTDDLRDQMKLVTIDLQRLQVKYQSLETRLAAKEMESKDLADDLLESRLECRDSAAQLEQAQEFIEQLQRRGEMAARQLHVQVEYGKDLEARLEQALARWKQEKTQFAAESARLAQLTRQCASLVQKSQLFQAEKENSEQRLQQYAGLPLPEEIKARLLDLSSDNGQLQARLLQLDEQRGELQDQCDQLRTALEESQRQAEDQTQRAEALARCAQELELQVRDLTVAGSAQDATVRRLEAQCTDRGRDLQGAHRELETCRGTLDRLTAELADARLQLQSCPLGASFGDPDQLQGALGVAVEPPAVTVPVVSIDEPTPPVPADRVSDIAVKHQVERAMGRDGASGLLQLIASAVEDERVVWRSLRSLRELVLHDEKCRQQCLASQPDVWLLPLMTRFLHVGMLQAQAARLLGTLSFGNDAFRRRAGEQRAMQCLAAALHVHLTDETLALHACTAVTNLAHGSYENRCRFQECGGLDVLVLAMERYAASAKLQCQGCWALLTLAGSDEVAEAVIQAGGDRAVLRALQAHGADAGVQQYGCWALRNLALASQTAAVALRAQGAMEVCRIALEQHVGNAEVLAQAKAALGAFANLSKPGRGQSRDSVQARGR